MEPKDYTLVKIEGEYAYLRPDDGTDEVFIALASFPQVRISAQDCTAKCLNTVSFNY